MKKIVRIIARLNVGGPAIHTVLLSEALNRGGYVDILVIGSVSESEGDMSYFAEQKNVKPVVIPEMKRDISFVDDIKAFFQLCSIIRKERPDIVHTHAAKAGTLGRLAAIVSGVPVKIHTFHGHVFDGYFSPFKAKIFLTIERFMALFTDRVITVSDAVRDEIVHKLKVTSDKKCVVIPLGLELDPFLGCEKRSGILRKEFGIGDDVVLVGIIGRLVPIKNHKMFSDAAKMIIDNRPAKGIKFLIIGDGEMRPWLEDYTNKLGIEQNVIFTGWRKDLAPVYSDLDIVALTSLNEGTPVSLIEAMASAKPVIATDVGGVRDIVIDGENGFLVKSNDVGGFSDKLIDLLSDKAKRDRFGMCGRESVKMKYSKERLVKDIESLYEECLRNREASK